MVLYYCIEDIPVIIRFKTLLIIIFTVSSRGIEDIPVIIRFKTLMLNLKHHLIYCIEDIPVIIRFKTFNSFMERMDEVYEY